MKTTRRLISLATLLFGMHFMTLCIQPIVLKGVGSGGQSCADDPETEMDNEY